MGCFFLTSLLAEARVIEDWRYRHPLPHNQPLWRVEYGEGVYVMVGAAGALTTTTDLAGWKTVFYPGLIGLDGLLYANGGFLATSRSGAILASPDGMAWSEQATGTDKGLLCAAYGNGRYVLAGEDGTTATSTDGQAWTIGNTGNNGRFVGMAYGRVGGQDVFVSVSYDETTTGAIATSSNGVTWTLVGQPAGFPSYIEYYDVNFGGGRFVASGFFYDEVTDGYGMFIATSLDGKIWTRATKGVPLANDSDPFTPTVLNTIRYDAANNLWVGVGDMGVLITSPDGVNWTVNFPFGTEVPAFYGIGFSPAGRVVVGDFGEVYYSPAGSTQWQRKSTGSYTVSLADIEFNGATYVASGSAILTSTDGINWQRRLTWEEGGTLANLAYGQGRWVAGSRNTASQTPLLTSADGAAWAAASSLPAGFTGCHDLAYGNGLFIALPQGGTSSLVTSTDGLNWTGRNHPWFDGKQSRCYISFGNGLFLAYSLTGGTLKIASSANGIEWATTSTALTGSYVDAAYGDGRWVLVGDNGRVATSTNLADWSEQTITFGGGAPAALESVAFGKGHWVICGAANSICSSEDGLAWIPSFKAGEDLLFDVLSSTLFDGLAFWTVGNFGSILRSSPLLDPASLSILPSTTPRAVLLQIDGTPGDRWNILASPTLANPAWSVLTTITLQGPTAIISDPVAGNKFYFLSPP